ncbi:response regulator transcription factor [Flavihumibacter sp. R14]|nr:response regulator transcription factor [Flavihumibacter soli]
MIRVLLAEDHNIVRNGIRSLLDSESDIKVMGEAANGKEAIRVLEENTPVNLIILDLNMPGIAGSELIKYISSNFKDLKILILSMSDHEKYVSESFNAGADGYLLKNVSKDELVFAVKHLMVGGQYICSELSLRMLAKISSHEVAQAEPDGFADFTKRELEVLKLIAEGFTNNEIAEKLFTSRRTVEGHRQSLIEKTGVSNSASLIMHAFRNGIIK